MNKLIKSAIIITVATIGLSALTGCSRIEPGTVGIRVNQWGDQKGVEDFPLITGMVFYNPITTDVYKFPTFVQNAVWTREKTTDNPSDDSITFNSVEGAIINADIALAYSFLSDKVPSLFVEFRQTPDVITHGFMKNEINNAFNRVASTMKATDIFGERKQYLLDEVRRLLNENLTPKGFKFELISFHGALRVDQSVQSRISAVLEASQRAIEAETKVRQAKAEADQAIEKARGEAESNLAIAAAKAKAITLTAEAEAKGNKLVAESLTPVLVSYKNIEKWNGQLPQFYGGGVLPFLNVSTNR